MNQPPQDTKATLLNAALACFAEHGFDGTSIRMIGDRAKRPLSLLSHHFGCKEELYREVFEYILVTLHWKNTQDPRTEGTFTPRDVKEAIQILREQIHQMYADCVQNLDSKDPVRDWAIKLWLQEIRSPRPVLVPLLKEYKGPRADLVKKCIQVIRPEMSEGEVKFVAATLLGQVVSHGLMHGYFQILWGPQEFPGTPFQASELLMNLWMKGLLGGPLSA